MPSGGMPVSPSSATLLPGCNGVCSRMPVEAEPVSAGVDAEASERTPGGLTASWTTRPSAFTAPRFGSWRYMIRQVTPVANAEIAIGRKTTVLKATDQRTRSVSTAKISPTAVTNAGTIATQIKLFLIELSRMLLEKLNGTNSDL